MKTYLVRSFLFSLLLFISVHTYAAVVCYDTTNSFIVTAPKGWREDFEAAKKLGICVVYIPEGKFNFDNAPAIMYPNLVANKKSDLNNFIKGDEEKFKKKAPKAKFSSLAEIKSKSGLTFLKRKILNGPTPNDFEITGYHAAKSSVFLIVLSARDNKSLDKYESGLNEFIRSVVATKRSDLYDGLRKIADASVQKEPGKKFETQFIQSVAEALANTMKTCGDIRDRGFQAVLTVSAQGVITEWTNKEEAPMGECVRKAMKSKVGAKPPTAPFHLPLDMQLNR